MLGTRDRGNLWHLLAILVFAFMLTNPALAEEPCKVDHPLDPPQKHFAGRCPNCGMTRAMWARTWVSFENSNATMAVCSLHCLADWAVNSGESPWNVMGALYLNPRKMIPAEEATFVVGSRAKGTMTTTSKLAFESLEAAQAFAAGCGGQPLGFAEVFAAAKAGLEMENQMIARKRLDAGKIVPPVDNGDECPVCQMFPARYPRHQCQVVGSDGSRRHFCSTQCLFEFLEKPGRYGAKGGEPFWAWVKDYASGEWIAAESAYFVVGSRVLGPMGFEALPFAKRTQAEAFVKTEGGRILAFHAVGPDQLQAASK